MFYLLQNSLGWLFAALALGVVVGWAAWSRDPRASWFDGWAKWGAVAVVAGLAAALLALFPGRWGMWVETALLYFAAYIGGCFLGGWARHALGFETMAAPAAVAFAAASPGAPAAPSVDIFGQDSSASYPGIRPAGLAAPMGRADDLGLISGVVPLNQKFCNDIGVYHVSQVAGWTPQNAQWIDHHLGQPGLVSRERWIEQAKALAQGKGAAAPAHGVALADGDASARAAAARAEADRAGAIRASADAAEAERKARAGSAQAAHGVALADGDTAARAAAAKAEADRAVAIRASADAADTERKARAGSAPAAHGVALADGDASARAAAAKAEADRAAAIRASADAAEAERKARAAGAPAAHGVALADGDAAARAAAAKAEADRAGAIRASADKAGADRAAAAAGAHPGIRPQGAPLMAGAKGDDLKWIKGIGPKNEKTCNDLGVNRFSQIAAWTPDNATWMGHHMAFPGRIEREHWVAQARLLAAGVDTDHSAGVKSGAIRVDESADAPLSQADAASLHQNLPQAAASVEGEGDHHGARPLGLAVPRGGKADDLKRIKGIGKQNETRLHGLGVWHFDQIAAWTAENVKWAGSYLAFPGRIDREAWINQARDLAAGRETEFSKRVAAGRVPTSSDDGSLRQGSGAKEPPKT